MHSVDASLRLDTAYRPDGFYGLSKMWGEGLARMYWDKHGIESVCLRIGSASEGPPENRRHLSTWLAKEDLIELVRRSIEAPAVGYAEVWGISDNSRAFYDLSQENAIGYCPAHNAETWAETAEPIAPHPDPLASRLQGGAFAVHDYTPSEKRQARMGEASISNREIK